MLSETSFYHALNIATATGHRTLSRLKEEYGTWRKIWEEKGKEYRVDPEKAWEELETCGIELILKENENFPPLLREIPLSPHGIYVKGDKEVLKKTSVAIV